MEVYGSSDLKVSTVIVDDGLIKVVLTRRKRITEKEEAPAFYMTCAGAEDLVERLQSITTRMRKRGRGERVE